MIRLLIFLAIKKLQPIVAEIFTDERKLNITLVFIIQSSFRAPKKCYSKVFLMSILTKWEPQWIAFNQSSDIDFVISTSWIFTKNVL